MIANAKKEARSVSCLKSRPIGPLTVSVETFVGQPSSYLGCPHTGGHAKYQVGGPTKVSTETVTEPRQRLRTRLTRMAE